jgi:YD repeat-containing protein
MRDVLLISLAIVCAGLMFSGDVWAASGSATYVYDSRGRLGTVTYGNGTTIMYTYDNAGNRTNVTVTCGGGGC